MKITKLLVIFLVLSMLLVSCNGAGSGAATTEPDVPVSAPDTSDAEPVPGSQWGAAFDSRTNIALREGGTIKKLFAMDEVVIKSKPIKEEERFADLDSLIAEYSGDRCYVIQFTPTTDYVYDKNTEKTIIHGIVDKKYSGDERGCVEGAEIQIYAPAVLITLYDECDQYVLNFDQYIFRKGYSYFVCLTRGDVLSADMRYEYYLISKATAYEYSSIEGQKEFLSKIGGEREFSLIEQVFANYPKVESKYVHNDSSAIDPTATYINLGEKSVNILDVDYYAIHTMSGSFTVQSDIDELIEVYSNDDDRMIIQFTPTDNYQYNKEMYKSTLSIKGTVDKIHSKGSSIELAEGDTVDLTWGRAEILNAPLIDGARYMIGLETSNGGTTLFRKGYSYLVFVDKTDSGFSALIHDGIYEYSSFDEQYAFASATRWERDYRFLVEIIKKYPEV